MLKEIITTLGPVNVIITLAILVFVSYIALNWIVFGIAYLFGGSWSKGINAGQNSY